MDKILKMIQHVKLKAKKNFVPIVRDFTLNSLLEICKTNGVKSVLEIGTATGYSGLNLLTVATSLTTIEKNEDRFNEAKGNFENAGVGNRVSQILGDAGEILSQLVEQCKQFDLVFLDGPKGQYKRYLPFITKLLKGGGILFADNILVGGLLHDESRVNHKNRTMVRNMKEFLEAISDEAIYNTEIFEIDDGFAICKKL